MVKEIDLSVENWRENPEQLIKFLLGNRHISIETGTLGKLMKEVVCFSDKKWSRNIDQYDVFDLNREIDSRKRLVSILDIGCGDGNVLAQIKENYGNKVSCSGVSVMSHPHNVASLDYYICPAELLPFSWENKFDIVLTHQAFRYMLFPQMALEEAIRVTKKGGIFGGYIGVMGEEERIMYDSNQTKDYFNLKVRNSQEYTNNFLKILEESPHNFNARVQFENNVPHAIYLKKGGNKKEIQII